jgi:hypothetical protein
MNNMKSVLRDVRKMSEYGKSMVWKENKMCVSKVVNKMSDDKERWREWMIISYVNSEEWNKIRMKMCKD